MKSDVSMSIGFTVIATLLTWLAYYQISKKLNTPDSSTEWTGLIILAVFAFIMIFLAGGWWFQVFLNRKSVAIDADFVGLQPYAILKKENGEKIYQWKLECRWHDPVSGSPIIFTSEPFDGIDLYYNRSKIRVSVLPEKAETFYTVDLSFLTTKAGSGIKLVNQKQLEEAELHAKEKEQAQLSYEKDQQQKRENGIGLTIWLNRIALAGTGFMILIAIVLGGWFYIRNRATQTRIEEFVNKHQKIMQAEGWDFSFQPYDRLWQGLGSLRRSEGESPLPEGFAEIMGHTNGTKWTLEIVIKRESTRGYYRSPEHFWLKNSNYSRLTMQTKKYNENNFLAFIEIPKLFPDKLKHELARSHVVEESHYFASITAEPDRDILHEYIYVLFDPFNYKNALHESNETIRWGERYLNAPHVTIANTPNTATQLIDQKVKADLRKIGNSENGGYGILVSDGEIMISTLNVFLKPGEIRATVDLGLQLKKEIEKNY